VDRVPLQGLKVSANDSCSSKVQQQLRRTARPNLLHHRDLRLKAHIGDRCVDFASRGLGVRVPLGSTSSTGLTDTPPSPLAPRTHDGDPAARAASSTPTVWVPLRSWRLQLVLETRRRCSRRHIVGQQERCMWACGGAEGWESAIRGGSSTDPQCRLELVRNGLGAGVHGAFDDAGGACSAQLDVAEVVSNALDEFSITHRDCR